MKMAKRLVISCGLLCIGLAVVWACGFDDTLREYLDARFWLPFAKQARHFERRKVRRVSLPYAGMTKAEGESPMAKLRAAYQEISDPSDFSFDPVSNAVRSPPRAPTRPSPPGIVKKWT